MKINDFLANIIDDPVDSRCSTNYALDSLIFGDIDEWFSIKLSPHCHFWMITLQINQGISYRCNPELTVSLNRSFGAGGTFYRNGPWGSGYIHKLHQLSSVASDLKVQVRHPNGWWKGDGKVMKTNGNIWSPNGFQPCCSWTQDEKNIDTQPLQVWVWPYWDDPLGIQNENTPSSIGL